MTELNFTETDAPKVSVGRVKGPNPFDGHFPTKEGKALAQVFTGVRDEKDPEVRPLINAARRCAESLETPMTARIKLETEGKGKTGTTTVSFWTVPKITRKPASE